MQKRVPWLSCLASSAGTSRDTVLYVVMHAGVGFFDAVTAVNLFIDSPCLTWVGSFLYSVISALSGVKRHVFMSPQEKLHSRYTVNKPAWVKQEDGMIIGVEGGHAEGNSQRGH